MSEPQIFGGRLPGPRVSDRDLIDALALDRPELSAVGDAGRAGDTLAAKSAFAEYLRTRRLLTWHVDPHDPPEAPFDEAVADRAVAGEVVVCGIPHAFHSGPIDWMYNATREREDIPTTLEWQWQLNRMNFWLHMARAYSATGEPRYPAKFAEQLRTWARQCPRPDDNGNYADSPWRTIEAGIRMAWTWPEVFHRFVLADELTDGDLALFAALCLDHGRHLRAHQHRNNWVMMEMAGLYTIGAVFPEFRDAAEWRAFALNRLRAEQRKQFLPDGMQFELTTSYHQVALRNVLAAVELARATDREDELPEGLLADAERAFEPNVALMTPDRKLPKLNDSGEVDVRRAMVQAARLFPHRPDFLWAATDGEKGTPPKFISAELPYAGYAAMRSGWGRDDTLVVFDAGPLGTGHAHEDKLSLAIWAFGRELLFDAGGGMYDDSPFRRYDVDTFAHNTVLVGGQAQRRLAPTGRWARLDLRWRSTRAFDFAAGVYEGPYGNLGEHPATHHRRVLFVKPDVVIVADSLDPTDGAVHAVQARWHLRTTAAAHDQQTDVVRTLDSHRPNLVIVPLGPGAAAVSSVSGQTDPELLGWYVTKTPMHEPATTVVHDWQAAGPSTRATLLAASRAGEELRVRTVQRNGGRAEVILDDGRSWTVRVDPLPAGAIEFDEILADGSSGRSARARTQASEVDVLPGKPPPGASP